MYCRAYWKLCGYIGVTETHRSSLEMWWHTSVHGRNNGAQWHAGDTGGGWMGDTEEHMGALRTMVAHRGMQEAKTAQVHLRKQAAKE